VLIVHGRNDPQVPLNEVEQMVYRLRNKGGEVWYLQAGDEGHSLRKKPDRDAYYRTFAQFLTSLSK
jgi:dipeptidyl aminopeptidase/acylaminoacyl peptidase